MPANARQIRKQTLLASDLHPPRSGLRADPVLYGVAAGLQTLFPLVTANGRSARETAGSETVKDLRSRTGSN
jgi:hypothetical protein